MQAMKQKILRGRTGFTLIELSIVLVIISLILGGIMAGRVMLENAALQSVVADFNQYRQAVTMYRDKYRELPGDHSAATTITSADANCPTPTASNTPTTATCNGDSNGFIGDTTGDPLGSITNYQEVLQVWQHLGNAGYIPGQYTGRRSTLSSEIMLGVNIPKSKIEGAGFMLRYFPTNTVTTGYFSADYGHVFFYGGPSTSSSLPLNGGVLTTEQAKAIDLKIDDGKPGLGKVLTSPYSVTSTCVTNTASEVDAAYDGTITGRVCSLIFISGF